MWSDLCRCEARLTTEKDPLKSLNFKHDRPTQTRLSGGSRRQAES